MESKKYIVMTAGSMDWRIRGIYDSKEQILEQFKKDWGADDLTMDDIDDYGWQRDNELKIEEGYYYPDLKTIRDNKITEVIGQ